MIVPMKKITVLEAAKRREAVAAGLKRLGVLHVHQTATPVSAGIRAIEQEMERAGRAMTLLGLDQVDRPPVSGLAPEKIVERLLEAARDEERAMREIEEREGQFRWFETWGAVSGRSLRLLRNHGLHVRFYVIPRRAYAALAAEKLLVVVRDEGGVVRCALFTGDLDDRLDYLEEPIPDIEYGDLVAEKERLDRSVAGARSVIESLKVERPVLAEYRLELERRLEFGRVRDGMSEESSIVSLEGFCPIDQVAAFRTAADAAGWAYAIADPDDPDVTPTLVRNSKFVEIIAPVFRFMGTVPGYGEFDVSVWFLIFLSIFFALLVGDAAYGFIFLGVTSLVYFKYPDVPRQPLRLLLLFSVATIVWGAVTGTWFGYAPIARLPGFSALVIGRVDSFVDANQTFMIFFCFTIGVIHLTIAHLVAGFRVINSLQALAQAGWILTVWAGYFIAGFLVINRPLPSFTLPLLGAGIGLSLVFTNIGLGLFKGMSRTILELPFSVINAFGDVVSYIRLFAVGMATVVVATSFNDMCLELGAGSLLAGLAAAVALFVGHVINIVLAMMSVMVHGIRLNMLEFSGHLGMQWSGREYRPFKE